MTAQVQDASREDPRAGAGLVSVPGTRLLRRLVRGVVGGLIATALMTLYRFPVFRALPPTADFWATYVGDGDAETHPGVGLLLHFLYGGVAGGLFGVATGGLDGEDDATGLAVMGLSVAYGFALSAFGTRFVFRYLLDEELEPDEAVIFHAGHLVYGLALGTWLSFDERAGEAYE